MVILYCNFLYNLGNIITKYTWIFLVSFSYIIAQNNVRGKYILKYYYNYVTSPRDNGNSPLFHAARGLIIRSL